MRNIYHKKLSQDKTEKQALIYVGKKTAPDHAGHDQICKTI